MRIVYFNAYWKDNLFIESEELTYEEAVQDIADSTHPYAFTLEVDLSEEEAKKIDLESEALALKYPEEDEYERLTGHEMGIKPGRI